MKITRTYYNSSGDLLRTDTIEIVIGSAVANLNPTIGRDANMKVRTGPQELRTELNYETSVSRDVDAIKVVGNFDTIETSSGNFTWAKKTLGNNQVIQFDMSNLPVVGDTI